MPLALPIVMATISNFHDKNLPQDELPPRENGGRKRSYSDTQPAATPRDCPGVGAPDKRRKENLASEQDWVHLGPTTTTKQPDLSGRPFLPPPENAGMPVTASGVFGEHSLELMTVPSVPGMDLTSFDTGNMDSWNLFPERPEASDPAVGETSSFYSGDLVGS